MYGASTQHCLCMHPRAPLARRRSDSFKVPAMHGAITRHRLCKPPAAPLAPPSPLPMLEDKPAQKLKRNKEDKEPKEPKQKKQKKR